MNKWWLVGIALPAVAGFVWIGISSATDEKAPLRSVPKPPSSDVAASSPVQAQLPPSVNAPRKTAASATSTMPAPNKVAYASHAAPMATKDLQELLDKDPKAALAVAREDLTRDPEGPDAAERTWVVVKALTVMGRHDEARREAEVMVPKFRGTRWANDVERHVLAHP